MALDPISPPHAVAAPLVTDTQPDHQVEYLRIGGSDQDLL
jgi:hypothetical protein